MPARTRDERLFGAACLKVTLARKGGAGAASTIYQETLADLELEDAEVDAYLKEHGPEVEAALQARGVI